MVSAGRRCGGKGNRSLHQEPRRFLGHKRTYATQKGMSALPPKADMCSALVHVRFSNRPVWVKRFQTIHEYSVDVARGLALLFGIGTRALPLWDSRTRRNNLSDGLAARVTVGPSGHANSPHPSSREGHHSTARWSFECSPISCGAVRLSCHCGLPGPLELGAINPDAVHDHGQPARQRHDCLLHSAVPGDLHAPGLEPGPSL
jgi:hypothetical protein